MKSRNPFQLAILLIVASAAPATAQSTPLFNFLTRTTIPIVIQCPGCNAANKNNRPVTPRPAPQPPETSTAGIGSLTYEYSDEVRQRVVGQVIESLRVDSPDTAERLERAFIANDVIGRVHEDMAEFGLDDNNLADAYAFYWANAWQVFSGRSQEPSDSEIMAVRSQTARILCINSTAQHCD
jgi:hypothetical protein